MNQHFDHDDEMNNDEFAKRLAAMSLIEPSDKYRQIPDKFRITATTRVWEHWKWITVGWLTSLVVALTIMFVNFARTDAIIENESVNMAAVIDATEQVFISGQHYIELPDPIAEADSTAIEVVTFFWYPCWPCSEFEDYLADWESELDAGITLTRIPAIWSPAMRFHARAYFTARELGVLDRSHREFYVMFKKDNTTVSNEEELQQFFQSIGVSAAEFMRVYHSETIDQLLNHAEELNRLFQIQSTPSLFVAGKYRISPQSAGGFQEMLEVTDFLLEGL